MNAILHVVLALVSMTLIAGVAVFTFLERIGLVGFQ